MLLGSRKQASLTNVERLGSEGHTVFATCHNVIPLSLLHAAHGNGIHLGVDFRTHIPCTRGPLSVCCMP